MATANAMTPVVSVRSAGMAGQYGRLAVGEAGDEGCPRPDQHGGIAETEGHRLDDQLPVAPPPCAHVPDYSQREPRPCTPMNGAGAGAAVTDLLGSHAGRSRRVNYEVPCVPRAEGWRPPPGRGSPFLSRWFRGCRR